MNIWVNPWVIDESSDINMLMNGCLPANVVNDLTLYKDPQFIVDTENIANNTQLQE